MSETRTVYRTVHHEAREVEIAPSELPMLDVHAPEGVSSETAGIDALAIISAGYRETGKDGHAGLPHVSRDGTIYLHDPTGRAPGLKAALAARGNKGLTIGFPFNNPAAFVQQRFIAYSSTHLLIYGDEYCLTEIKGGEHVTHEAGTDEYAALLKRCKTSISIYFALAEWGADGPRVVFPDGLGLYRLRSTSRNTMRNLRAALKTVSAFTRGQLVGVPFDLALDYRDVSGPDGAKRNVPCWTFTMKPPVAISSRTFAPVLTQALREGRMLQLPPPSAESMEAVAAEYENLGVVDDEPDRVDQIPDEMAQLLTEGGLCDAEHYRRRWFAAVEGTDLDDDGARERWIAEYSRDRLPDRFPEGYTDSLAALLARVTEAEAAAMMMALENDLEAPAPPIAEEPEEPGHELPGPEPVQQASFGVPLPVGKRETRSELMVRWGLLWNDAMYRKLKPPERVSTGDTDDEVREKILRLDAFLSGR